jgi:hypothetical protein
LEIENDAALAAEPRPWQAHGCGAAPAHILYHATRNTQHPSRIPFNHGCRTKFLWPPNSRRISRKNICESAAEREPSHPSPQPSPR